MMKRFINRLSIFLLILICGLIIYSSLLFKVNSGLVENYKFDPKISTLIAGDSHTQYSINDSLLANTRNISQNSEGFIFSYYKLKKLLPNNPGIKTILLGAGYHSFSSYYKTFRIDPVVFSKYCFILPADKQLGLLFETKDIFSSVQKSIISGTTNWMQNGVDSSFLGGFDSYSTSIPLSYESIEKRIDRQFLENNQLRDCFEENIFYFGKIKQLCKDLNVRLIVLNTPMHPKYKEEVPQKFIDEYNKLVKDGETEVIEFDGLHLSDNDFLPDGDHLRISGAVLTTLYLKNLLNTSVVRK